MLKFKRVEFQRSMCYNIEPGRMASMKKNKAIGTARNKA